MVRRRRPALAPYAALAGPAECAISDLRGLAQRAAAALRAGEMLPGALAPALRQLAAATDVLGEELRADRDPAGARRQLEQLGRAAGPGLLGAGGFAARVVLVRCAPPWWTCCRRPGHGEPARSRSCRVSTANAAERPPQVSSATPPR